MCGLGIFETPMMAQAPDELRQSLGLFGRTTGKGKVPRSSLASRPVELFMCSVLKQTGCVSLCFCCFCLLHCHVCRSVCPLSSLSRHSTFTFVIPPARYGDGFRWLSE